MKIAIIGTGGVGAYFGARMADAGYEVKFLARGEHLKAIQRQGLVVKSTKGDMHIKEAFASNKYEDFSDCELFLFATKAWQLKDAAQALVPYISENATLLPLQNGVLATSELTQFYSPDQVLGGLCMIFSEIEVPGVIHHKGLEPSITFGEIDRTVNVRTQQVEQFFKGAGITCNISKDISAAIWRKFMLICLSALGAIGNTGYGLLRETVETSELIRDILEEVHKVAIAKRIRLEDDIVDKSMNLVEKYPYDAMSSLARDVLAGKPSEIEYQNGTIVRIGETLGVDTPVNKTIYALIKLLEAKGK